VILQTENKLYHFVRAVRPRQWIKNGVVFAPIIFKGELFEIDFFFRTVLAFIYFCVIASAIYLINDCRDLESDRAHPIKKDRPIAAGKISVKEALTAGLITLATAIPSAYILIGSYFGTVLLFYTILQFAYIFKLKNIIIVDALAIATGFILRVFSGALAIPISISSWLVLAVTGVSLLLAFGKRRAERTLLQAKGISNEKTRKLLKHYPDTLLDSMISMSASFAIITYSLFTFQTSPDRGIGVILEEFLPSTLIGAKLLMLTIPFVIYGVARYLYVIYEKRQGESPERILISDKPLLFNTILWAVIVIFITN